MFWANFVNYCNSVGKAPNVVASEIGVKSSGTVTGWKNGATPRQSILIKLANYFGISVADLTGEEQQKKPAPVEEGEPYIKEFIGLIQRLTPEERERELAYLRSRAAERDM